MESAFRAFGGVALEVLLDNANAPILRHNPTSREVMLIRRCMHLPTIGGSAFAFVRRARATKQRPLNGIGF
jgi:hypothetical protein